MPQYDAADYWNQETSGYDQMPEGQSSQFEKYDISDSWQEQTPWEGGTYAPWDTDVGDTWLNNLASGFPNESFDSPWTPGNIAMGMGAAGLGAMTGGALAPAMSYLSGPAAGWTAGSVWGGGLGTLSGAGSAMGSAAGPGGFQGMLHRLSGKGRKRSSPEFYMPSFQGKMFTPEEGFPDYYYPSLQGTEYNQTQQELYNPDYTQMNTDYPQQNESIQNSLNGGSYDYNYGGSQSQTNLQPQGNPDYIGQSIYGRYGQGTSGGGGSLSQTFKPGEFGQTGQKQSPFSGMIDRGWNRSY